ncbi:MAG: hypothetical protein ACXIUZ_12230 [Lysobacteraceae bacterium]
MRLAIALALCVAAAGCAVPPPQRHAMDTLVVGSSGTPLASCGLWLDSVTDLRPEDRRSSNHGMLRVEVEQVPEAVSAMLAGLGVGDAGAPGDAVTVEVLNAYLSTVAGMRAFNLVLRVRHADGGQWVARGRTVSVPWTMTQASIRNTLELALEDARDALVLGLSSRCDGAVAAR